MCTRFIIHSRIKEIPGGVSQVTALRPLSPATPRTNACPRCSSTPSALGHTSSPRASRPPARLPARLPLFGFQGARFKVASQAGAGAALVTWRGSSSQRQRDKRRQQRAEVDPSVTFTRNRRLALRKVLGCKLDCGCVGRRITGMEGK